MKSESVTHAVNQRPYANLGLCVFAPNSPHVLATAGYRQAIHSGLRDLHGKIKGKVCDVLETFSVDNLLQVFLLFNEFLKLSTRSGVRSLG